MNQLSSPLVMAGLVPARRVYLACGDLYLPNSGKPEFGVPSTSLLLGGETRRGCPARGSHLGRPKAGPECRAWQAQAVSAPVAYGSKPAEPVVGNSHPQRMNGAADRAFTSRG